MPPRAAVKHLTPADLVIRWHREDGDGSTTAGERYLTELRAQGRGPSYIRGESDGKKAIILYRLADVEAWEERQLVRTAPA